MRKPLQSNPARRPVSRTATVPAPVGGWNARDAISDMPVMDALLLDNYFPGTTTVDLRKGYSAHGTGLGGAVEFLFSWASGGSSALLAAANGRIWDVTSAGAGTSLASGFTSNRWQGVMQGGYALLFNGVSTPQKYDGSTVSNNSITGVTSTSLIAPWVFKRRVFAIEKNTLSAWYLANDAISGSASELDFSSYCPLGGHLVAGGTWTRDGGSGVDDLCVFVTSQGEVLVFQGTDPSSASTWSLVGVFRIAPPVGTRPLLQLGADLIAITLDGFVPMSLVISNERIGKTLSDKIRNAVSSATRMYKGNFGWQAIHYPQGTRGLFNVPIAEGTKSHQYVVNTLTGSWCRFTGMNANCWAVHNDNLYFGGSEKVYLADTGTSDSGAVIEGDIRPAFNYFSPRATLKHFKMFRPVISSTGSPLVNYVLDTDFSERTPTSELTLGGGGAQWDTFYWDTTPWGGSPIPVGNWYSITGIGFCASPRIRTRTNGLEISLAAFDYVYEAGGVL